MAGVGQRFRDSGRAFLAVWRNAGLRWLELAWSASSIAYFGHLIAVSVYAYDIGGERAVGLLFLARLIPAALIAPFAGILGDRYSRERVLFVTNATRVVLVGATAIAVFADADAIVVYVLSIAVAIATTPYRSAQAALTPGLAGTPEELTAANAVASGVESIAVFAGPALAGVLFATTSTGMVFAITALILVGSLLCIALIPGERRPQRRHEVEASTIASEALAGFSVLGRHPALRVIMVLLTAQTAVAGAIQVFIVVSSFELLGLGEGGVGYLNAAMGAGAFVGAIAALSLTGARRLSPAFLVGVVLAGAPLVVIGISPEVVVAVLLLGVLGAGISLVDIAGLTLVQRAVPDDVLARVFGVIQMLWLFSLGLGAALVPALISVLGLENALIAAGLLLPVLAAALASKVVRIDAGAAAPDPEELRILGRVPIFAPLSGGTLEHLASRLVPLRLSPGTVIVHEGDAGDRFYIVAEGKLAVTQEGVRIAELEPGGYFGEIALLRDMARTATVTTESAVVLYALDREDFLAAVTGHPQSAEAAETVMSARLAGPASTGYRSALS